VVVDSPAPGSFVREPEIDVSGRVISSDGRAFIWVDGVEAVVEGAHFVAHRVPVEADRRALRISITDGRGRPQIIAYPISVEFHERPRQRTFTADGHTLSFEVRGRPHRGPDGRADNVVVVIAPFGYPPDIDRFWPELVGLGAPIDLTDRYLVTLSPVRDPDGAPPETSLIVGALRSLEVGRAHLVIGAASLGGELVLRWLSEAPESVGHALVVGAHGTVGQEPAILAITRSIANLCQPADVSACAADPQRFWRSIGPILVESSYTPSYFQDLERAQKEHALGPPASAAAFKAALTDKMITHFTRTLTPSQMRVRMAFSAAPTVLPERAPSGAPGVTFVHNVDDRLISEARVRATCARLRDSGFVVTEVAVADGRGHSAFFGEPLPKALTESVRALSARPLSPVPPGAVEPPGPSRVR
jgi:hypothetical protein